MFEASLQHLPLENKLMQKLCCSSKLTILQHNSVMNLDSFTQPSSYEVPSPSSFPLFSARIVTHRPHFLIAESTT